MQIKLSSKLKIIVIIGLIVTVAVAFTASDIYRDISEAVKIYSEVLKYLLINYADPIKPKQISENAIRSLLSQLDPYTVLMTEEEKEPLDILTKGNYGGVGLRITSRNDTITVISAIEGSPGMRANILPGDQILKIDTIDAKGLSVDKAASLIRGAIGTKVTLLIRRPGFGEPKAYILQREKIEVKAVTYSDIIRPGIGYIKLAEFSKGAANELRQIITGFNKREKLNGLILDLRGNHGGLLEEALAVAELFTNLGDTLLIVRGQSTINSKIYRAFQKPLIDPETKLVILIDGGSASASEIVAGIAQDLDRGLVIGTPSFGKGLVQTVYRISSDYSIKITTAKYYIPSGRLIQKPDYIKNTKLVELPLDTDSVFYSRNKRKFSAKGGIIPDITTKPVQYPEFVSELWRQNMFFNFVMKYRSKHNRIPQEIDSKILEDFRQYLKDSGFKFTEKKERDLIQLEKQLEEDKRFTEKLESLKALHAIFEKARQEEFDKNIILIAQGLETEFATVEKGLTGRIAVDLKYDEVVKTALNYLNNEREYYTLLGYNK